MKHYAFQCTKCGVSEPYKEWDAKTRVHMIAAKMDMRTFKSIRESVGQYQRSYVCPTCGQIVNMRFILGR